MSNIFHWITDEWVQGSPKSARCEGDEGEKRRMRTPSMERWIEGRASADGMPGLDVMKLSEGMMPEEDDEVSHEEDNEGPGTIHAWEWKQPRRQSYEQRRPNGMKSQYDNRQVGGGRAIKTVQARKGKIQARQQSHKHREPSVEIIDNKHPGDESTSDDTSFGYSDEGSPGPDPRLATDFPEQVQQPIYGTEQASVEIEVGTGNTALPSDASSAPTLAPAPDREDASCGKPSTQVSSKKTVEDHDKKSDSPPSPANTNKSTKAASTAAASKRHTNKPPGLTLTGAKPPELRRSERANKAKPPTRLENSWEQIDARERARQEERKRNRTTSALSKPQKKQAQTKAQKKTKSRRVAKNEQQRKPCKAPAGPDEVVDDEGVLNGGEDMDGDIPPVKKRKSATRNGRTHKRTGEEHEDGEQEVLPQKKRAKITRKQKKEETGDNEQDVDAEQGQEGPYEGQTEEAVVGTGSAWTAVNAPAANKAPARKEQAGRGGSAANAGAKEKKGGQGTKRRKR